MSRAAQLRERLAAVLSRGAAFVARRGGDDLDGLRRDLLSSRGEVSGVALAAKMLERFLSLSAREKDDFFAMLARLDPDPASAAAAAAAYAKAPAPPTLAALLRAAEPPRQELFRRLNLTPGGAAALVEMRGDLLARLPRRPEFRAVDDDLAHLFHSWFNRGFLELRPLNWRSPACILEKLIAYEAIHEIRGWPDLRRRLLPDDRRCFGFFHPAMPDEPLIFVEVALMRDIPAAVAEVLPAAPTTAAPPLPPRRARAAVFYSISKCHAGLRGVSFGSFLIKQVAETLAREHPGLKTFATLSPLPGLMQWTRAAARANPRGRAARALAALEKAATAPAAENAARNLLPPLAAEYLLRAKADDGLPRDRVARFHLGNGAVLERINWRADDSAPRRAQSAGLMVNYRYDLSKVERNHEDYAARRELRAARAVRALLPPGAGAP